MGGESGAPRRTRLVFLDHAATVGGAQLALLEHIAHLDARFEAHVILGGDSTSGFAAKLRDAGATVHPFDWPRLKHLTPRRFVSVVRQAYRLRRLVRRLRADVVIANTSRTAYTASLAIPRGFPVIWWVRDFDFGRRIFRLLRPAATRIVCVSKAIAAHYGCTDDPASRVVFVASGIHERLADVSAEDVAAERARWGAATTDVVVGFMGRLVEGKGPQDLIAAVGRLRDHRNLRLLVVGTGKHQDGDVEDAITAEVERQGLADVIRFAGFQWNEALYYRLFDVFVLSSRYREAMPTSVIQAMMAGTPVIATSTGGTPEVVIDGETGLLIPPASPADMADAIRRLLVDDAMRDRIARQGQEHALMHHRERAITPRIEAVYDELSPAR